MQDSAKTLNGANSQAWSHLESKSNLQGVQNGLVVKNPLTSQSKHSLEDDTLQELYRYLEARQFIIWEVCGWQNSLVSDLRVKFGNPTSHIMADRPPKRLTVEYFLPITELSQPFHVPHIGWSVLQGFTAIKSLNGVGWLHGDVSTTNIVFSRVSGCDGVAVKVLDLGLSKQNNENSGLPHRTGSRPFKAIPLLEELRGYPQRLEHKVGLDIESLIWVLLWIVRTYTNGKDANPPGNHPLRSWYFPSHDILTNKKSYFHNRHFTNSWYKSLADDMRSLAARWDKLRDPITKIATMLSTGYYDIAPDEVYGNEGLKQLEAWMVNIGWDVPRKSCSCPQRHCGFD
ncbi:hypothetical protein FRB90_001767 [Tulasnella sp. 427]|nr:hypothetical protein FRB90_001767 [Tulasnella sp. 427]